MTKAAKPKPEAAAPIVETPAPTDVYRPTLHADIRPDPMNPRKVFDDEGLDELAASVAVDGLIEPVLIRPAPGAEAGQFMLIAGERRWRAIGKAIAAGQWPADRPIPAMFRLATEQEVRRLALVENLQRRDLNAIEQARALAAIAELDGVSAAQIGRDLGFTERWAQQRLSLLKLPEPMQAQVEAKTLKVEDARQAVSIWPKLPTIKQVELRDGKITVPEAAAWLADQPEPLDLTADDLLILLEVGWQVAAKSNGWWTEIDCDYRGKAAGARLEKAKLLAFGCQRHSGGKTTVRLTQTSYAHLRAISGAGEKLERAALEPLVRKARVGKVGGNPLSEDYRPDAFKDVDQLFKSKRHLTAWLNAPHDVDPQLLEELRKAKDADRRRDAEWEAERKAEAGARAAEGAAKRAELEEEARRGRDFLDQVLALEGDASGLAGVLAAHGYEGPFAIGVDGNEPVIVDAQGKAWRGFACGLEALRRTMALSLNVALGLEATSGPAIEDAPWAIDPAAASQPPPEEGTPPRSEFVSAVAAFLLDDVDEDGEPILSDEEAEAKAERGLTAWLTTEGVAYGHPSYDWDETGALALAKGVRDGLGAQADIEEAIAAAPAEETAAEPAPAAEPPAEIPGYLRRLAGASAEQVAEAAE